MKNIDEIPPYTTTNNRRKNIFSVKNLKNNANKILNENNIINNEKLKNDELNINNNSPNINI